MTAPLTKMEIVHRLADRYGSSRYLEIATTETGFSFHLLDQARFKDCRRLLYRCPPDFSDGYRIDLRSPDDSIAGPAASLATERARFDIVFVDSNHTYAESKRDLLLALDVLAPGGFLVVHDCLPPDADHAAPLRAPGRPWCGVSYQAFLDVVLGRRDLRYLTVDTDYGVGVVRRLPLDMRGRLRRLLDRERHHLVRGWRAIDPADHEAAWQYFAVHQRQLLQLTTTEDFLSSDRGLD